MTSPCLFCRDRIFFLPTKLDTLLQSLKNYCSSSIPWSPEGESGGRPQKNRISDHPRKLVWYLSSVHCGFSMSSDIHWGVWPCISRVVTRDIILFGRCLSYKYNYTNYLSNLRSLVINHDRLATWLTQVLLQLRKCLPHSHHLHLNTMHNVKLICST